MALYPVISMKVCSLLNVMSDCEREFMHVNCLIMPLITNCSLVF